ncbi:MAG: OmpH family outer membrane protein [Spirochaeta sp.]|jgi:outer membrane protein|nr:OmpH family outer membrane protein [Spirochaeta sp.]
MKGRQTSSDPAENNAVRRARAPLRTVVFAALMVIFTGAAAHVSAEQLTTVAVVDIDRVYNSFYRDSRAVRELERTREEYQEEINVQVAELETLRDRRTRAENLNNQSRVESLTEEIRQLQQFLEDLTQRRRQQLQQQQENIITDDFLAQLQEAITFVAESEGYTVVMRSDQDGLQWWSPEVDISDAVVQRLIQIVDR